MGMKMFFTSLCLALIMAISPVTFASPTKDVQAQTADNRQVPLVVIRFNQQRVYFKRPMANAIQRALNISSDVRFRVIHYTPKFNNRISQERADRNFKSVMTHLQGLGVRPQNITVKNQIASGLTHTEVHLYAL